MLKKKKKRQPSWLFIIYWWPLAHSDHYSTRQTHYFLMAQVWRSLASFLAKRCTDSPVTWRQHPELLPLCKNSYWLPGRSKYPQFILLTSFPSTHTKTSLTSIRNMFFFPLLRTFHCLWSMRDSNPVTFTTICVNIWQRLNNKWIFSYNDSKRSHCQIPLWVWLCVFGKGSFNFLFNRYVLILNNIQFKI